MTDLTAREAFLAERVASALYQAIIADDCNVIKIFKGSTETAYAYKKNVKDSIYHKKFPWLFKQDLKERFSDLEINDSFYNMLVRATKDSGIKIARLTAKQDGVRIRVPDEITKMERIRMVSNWRDTLKFPPLKLKDDPVKTKAPAILAPGAQYEVPKKDKCEDIKKGEKMEAFSLSNLKDALVDKITHLDRKTVMILAIIALLLLIVGKYQTIKDILIGIKDKIKRSRNFKAMVEDGTNALNSLKKIVGVKDKEVKADEA